MFKSTELYIITWTEQQKIVSCENPAVELKLAEFFGEFCGSKTLQM